MDRHNSISLHRQQGALCTLRILAKQATAGSGAQLADCFYLSMKDVSTNLGVSQTSFKRICRDHGLARWPNQRLCQIQKGRRCRATEASRKALELERMEILNVEPDMELSFWQAVRKASGLNMGDPDSINQTEDIEEQLPMPPTVQGAHLGALASDRMPLIAKAIKSERQGTKGISKELLGYVRRIRPDDKVLKVLEELFHLPQVVAARRCGMGVTNFKALCREHGVMRWPARKINSMERRQKAATAAGQGPNVRNDPTDTV